MSLIVAKKIENCIIITSDTRLTYGSGDKRIQTHRPAEGLIKTINIIKDVNLSFAGEIVWVEKVMKSFENIKETLNLNYFINVLLHVNTESNFETEFILSIGENEPDSTKIFEIKNGKVRSVDSAWIGSNSAFSKFQEAYHNCTDPLGTIKATDKLSQTELVAIELPSNDQKLNELYMKCFHAMTEVVEERAVQEVGGFVVPCVYLAGWFRYIGYLYCFPIGFNKTINISSNPVNLGSAEEGSFAVCLGGGATFNLPIYFPHGKVGLIFSRVYEHMMKPECFSNISYKCFTGILDSRKIPHKLASINFENDSIGLV